MRLRSLGLVIIGSLAACLVSCVEVGGNDEDLAVDGGVTEQIAAIRGEWFIAPNGSSAGDGTASKPWDLATGLKKTASVGAGSTVWLRGGTYGTGGTLVYESTLAGTASAPITIRPYPGERPIVNAGLRARGDYVIYRGFEITNTSSARDGTGNITDARPPGIVLIGNQNKIINMMIYNTGRGGILFGWSQVSSGFETEIYGTLFWGNGIYDSSVTNDCGCRGDAIYANLNDASSTPVRYLRESIAFKNFNLGFKYYSQWDDHHVNGLHLEGNVAFDHTGDDYVVYSEAPTTGHTNALRFLNNYGYRAATDSRPVSYLGYSGAVSDGGRIEGNYLVCGATASRCLSAKSFKNTRIAGNTVVGARNLVDYNSTGSSGNTFSGNTYHGAYATPFSINGAGKSFAIWKSTTGFDATSTHSTSRPTATRVFVRPNAYEAGRGHVIVYNWSSSSSVLVDLSPILTVGQAYEIRDVQNPLVTVASGTYGGGGVLLPMNLTAVAPIVGNVHIKNVHTASEFNTFLVLPKSSGGSANLPPTVTITSPSSGAVVSGSVSIQASATDDTGVSKVEVYRGTTLVGIDTTAPYAAVFDTTSVANGSYTFTAKAFDTAGTSTSSSPVTVTVSNSTGTPTSITLRATADAYVRDGTSANTNYGSATILNVRTDSTTGNNRDTYVAFDLNTVTNVASAKLTFTAALGASATIPTSIYASGSETWTESGLTWNNRPARTTLLATVSVSGTAYTTYEVDLTAFIRAEKAAGKTRTTIILHDASDAPTYTKVYAKEIGTTPASLVIASS